MHSALSWKSTVHDACPVLSTAYHLLWRSTQAADLSSVNIPPEEELARAEGKVLGLSTVSTHTPLPLHMLS
jgi:hypothetical protein